MWLDLADIIEFSVLYGCLIAAYFIGKPGSILNRLCYVKGAELDLRRLRNLRRIAILGILFMTLCLVMSGLFALFEK